MLRTQKNFKFKNVFTNLQKACVAITPLLILIACGGDSGSSTKPADDGREVATVVDMGRCTNEREGDTVYVAEKMADYLCKNRTWVDLSTISHSETKHSSSSVAKGTLSAASGNSSAVQGTSSATPGSHTSTSSSSAVAPNSVSGTSAGKESDPAQGFIRENISVTGVAQKGPFKFGSPLNLYELKKDLSPSGRVYNDEINSNKGDFVIPKVNLAYPYAKLEVAGLYRNEVTGEWSKEPMTLFALTDFSDKRTQTNSDERVQVNINLLTHLEYERALYLVQEKGYSVYAAKKQAAQEIMTAFEFATAVTYSEDFAIFQNDGVGSGTIAGNGTLLAISALVMGNRSDAEIQSVIDKFREDIKTDGEWNDLQTKASMADWAHDFKYSTIRAAVKSWNILDIPDYETYLDVYWNNVYGLGGCSEIRKGTVAPNSNKLSKYYNKYFICKVDGSKYSWVSATTIEKDTYEWAAGKSGEFKKGNVTDTIYAYNGTKWEVAARETSIGVCGSKNAGVVSKFNGTYYICKSNAWGTATVLEYDTYGWKAGSEGAVKAGSVNSDKYYVYENGAWRASSGEIENNLGACVMSREGEVGESGSAYYICKSKTWTTATVLEYDTYGKTCLKDGSIVAGNVVDSNKYVCDAGTFRTATNREITLDRGCVSYTEGLEIREHVTTAIDNVLKCSGGLWNITIVKYVSKIGSMTDSRDGKIYKTVVIGNQNWMAENLNYSDSATYLGMKNRSWCLDNSADNCAKFGRLYTWDAAMDSAGMFSINGMGCGYGKLCSPNYPVRGICPEGWHLPDKAEWRSLFRAVGGNSVAGKALKSKSGWSVWNGKSGNGTDAFSFSVLPAGRYYRDPYYGLEFTSGGSTAFWTSSEWPDAGVLYVLFNTEDEVDSPIAAGDDKKKCGYYIRCLQD